MADLLERSEYTRPLYALSEAASLVDVPSATFRNWARGYRYKTLGGPAGSDPLVTTSGASRGRVVPFVGLSEGYVIAAFRRTGVPMQRLRPALQWLEGHMGITAALTSERLMTDGAEVLYDFGRRSPTHPETGEPAAADELVVVRNKQIVFRDVVQQYLQTIVYQDGRIRAFTPPRFGRGVTVDPTINFGQPSFSSRGVRVADVQSRVAAGEPAHDVAADYLLPVEQVVEMLRGVSAA